MLRYDFALSNKAFLIFRTVFAFNSYRSVHIGPVIASYSYRSDIIDKRYRIYSLSLLGKIAFKGKTIQILFSPHESNKLKKKLVFVNVCETKIFVSAIIRGEESIITRRYSVTAITLSYILSLLHNVLWCGETSLLLKVIIPLGVKKPLSLLNVITLVTFKPLSLLRVIALTSRQKR